MKYSTIENKFRSSCLVINDSTFENSLYKLSYTKIGINKAIL